MKGHCCRLRLNFSLKGVGTYHTHACTICVCTRRWPCSPVLCDAVAFSRTNTGLAALHRTADARSVVGAQKAQSWARAPVRPCPRTPATALGILEPRRCRGCGGLSGRSRIRRLQGLRIIVFGHESTDCDTTGSCRSETVTQPDLTGSFTIRQLKNAKDLERA